MPRTLIVAAALAAAAAAHAAPKVVDVIPASMSDETATDSEPSIAVHPKDPKTIVVTSFARGSDFEAGTKKRTPKYCKAVKGYLPAPLFLSKDGGNTWQARCIVPSKHAKQNTRDITVAFSGAGKLYAAAVIRTGAGDEDGEVQVLFTDDPSKDTLMQPIVRIGAGQTLNREKRQEGMTWEMTEFDYPIIVASKKNPNRLYMAFTDSAVDLKVGAITFNPATKKHTWQTKELTGTPGAPSVRVDAHKSGRVVVAFHDKGLPTIAVHDETKEKPSAQLVGLEAARFFPGRFQVSTGKAPSELHGWPKGNQRFSFPISVAFDVNHDHIYVAHYDTQLRIVGSKDGGKTFKTNLSAALLKDIDAKISINPSLAVNEAGTLGLLVQTFTESTKTWTTRFITRNLAGKVTAEVLRAWSSQAVPIHPDITPGNYIGEYNGLVARGTAFYGTFSAGNDPAQPGQGAPAATFARKVKAGKLVDAADKPVGPSIDPFFFTTAK